MKFNFIWTAWVVGALIAGAGAHAFADQQVDGRYPPDEPSASCLGIAPCAEPPAASSAAPSAAQEKLPDIRQRRYRGGRIIYEEEVRPKGSELAEDVLEQIYALPEADKEFLLDKLETARGFAIFPEVRKSGVMAATVYGRGIMAFRDDRYQWSTPILLSMQGRSVGPQFCSQCSRVIFIFDRICSVRDFLSGHHHISTTPTGTRIEHIGHPEPTDPMGISIYTVHNGVSMGQSIDSYSVQIDEEGNAELYGVDFKPVCLIDGVVAGPKLPWMLNFFQKMALPPGTPDSTVKIR